MAVDAPMGKIPLSKPKPGETVRVAIREGDTYLLDFSLETVTIDTSDADVLVQFDDGARMIWSNFFIAAGTGDFYFELPDGTLILGKDMAESISFSLEDFHTSDGAQTTAHAGQENSEGAPGSSSPVLAAAEDSSLLLAGNNASPPRHAPPSHNEFSLDPELEGGFSPSLPAGPGVSASKPMPVGNGPIQPSEALDGLLSTDGPVAGPVCGTYCDLSLGHTVLPQDHSPDLPLPNLLSADPALEPFAPRRDFIDGDWPSSRLMFFLPRDTMEPLPVEKPHESTKPVSLLLDEPGENLDALLPPSASESSQLQDTGAPPPPGSLPAEHTPLPSSCSLGLATEGENLELAAYLQLLSI